MTTPELTPADIAFGDQLFESLRAKVAGDELAAAQLAIPLLKADPIAAGAALAAFFAVAVRNLADHCHETPLATFDRLFSKPTGDQ